ncbi:MAG: hypothetical protein ABIC68_05635 [Candidatus Omnitrophota bacterium]
MRKLKLPNMVDIPFEDKWLSMEEYIEFINFTSTHLKKARKSKKDEVEMRINVAFSIK